MLLLHVSAYHTPSSGRTHVTYSKPPAVMRLPFMVGVIREEFVIEECTAWDASK
jgi:hypothetical protein